MNYSITQSLEDWWDILWDFNYKWEEYTFTWSKSSGWVEKVSVSKTQDNWEESISYWKDGEWTKTFWFNKSVKNITFKGWGEANISWWVSFWQTGSWEKFYKWDVQLQATTQG